MVRLLANMNFVDYFACQLHLHYVRHQLRVLQVPAIARQYAQARRRALTVHSTPALSDRWCTSEFGLNTGKVFGDLDISST